MIKAIETVYKGYRFRSRLEARWAVYFDALGVAWEYEKEGFDLGEDGWYLPDFWLPKHGIWVEIKPMEVSRQDVGDFLGEETFWADVPYIAATDAEWKKMERTLPGGPLIVIGGQPGVAGEYVTLDMGDGDYTICANIGVWQTCEECGFAYFGYIDGDDSDWCGYPCISCCDKCMAAHQSESLRLWHRSEKILFACTAARSARFEHGEKP